MNSHPAATEIRIAGRFDFSQFSRFKAQMEQALDVAHSNTIRVNLAQVEHIDSSALGMLLMLREQANAKGKKVEICQVRANVRELLAIAHFEELFTIT